MRTYVENAAELWEVTLNDTAKVLELRDPKGEIVLSDTISRQGERNLSAKAFDSGAYAVRFPYDLARTVI